MESRHSGGVASGLDLAQQQTLLDATVSQLYLVKQQREQYEHAIAVLTGHPASTFSVKVRPLDATPIPVPLGVPSDLLERRPDIATAERHMAYENAQVGVAKEQYVAERKAEVNTTIREFVDVAESKNKNPVLLEYSPMPWFFEGMLS